MTFSLIKKAKDLGATAAEARKIAKELKNLNKKPTQDIFKKKFNQVIADRVDKDTGGKQTTADLVGTKGEKVTVAKDKDFIEMSKTKGSISRAKLVTGLEAKERKGTITKQEKKLLDKLISRDALDFYTQRNAMKNNPYVTGEVAPYPMINVSPELSDIDLLNFLDRVPFEDVEFKDRFFTEVAVPMQDSFWLHKLGRTEEAIIEIQGCAATDWRRACFEWLDRRLK